MNMNAFSLAFSFLMLSVFSLKAQMCSEMLEYYKINVELEYISYDKKDKVGSRMNCKTLRTETQNDTAIVWLNIRVYDNKNNETSQSDMPLKCYNDMLIMDMRSVMPAMPANAQGSSDVRIEIKGDDMAFPPDAKAGQTLPDAEMEMTTYMGTMRLLSNKYAVRNRKVEGNERVTTPAGDFDCVKYSYDFEYNFLGKRTSRTEYWLKPGLGMVKTISYDKKGAVESRMELTKIR